MPKKVLCALPTGLLEQIDYVAQVEHRTRSDLIREALRRYIVSFKVLKLPVQTTHLPGGGKITLLQEVSNEPEEP